ncbi:glycosyltransferase [Geomobilimonas luticola]|uniref:Glycosyltransferase n=1 Tax=Geomobilimonas luticola TaxID=1114878 RepID=A0ABS5SA93_9BACT|nr:glycosyltransferase [Geomobilimonas luticola]MBT0652296.1 glycosyltransferase [Geomobilimonas luticola]
MGDERKMTIASEQRPLLSVVVPCFRAMGTLPALLESLELQTIGRDNFEIIIVDDGSDDGTCDYLAAQPAIRLVRQERRGPGEARNVGFAMAAAELVLYLDADLVASPSLLEAHLLHHRQNPHLAATGGSVAPARSYPLLSWGLVDHLCSWFNAYPDFDHGGEPEYLPSLNFCVKKGDLLAVGGIAWQDGLTVTGEDVVFCYALHRAGLAIAFVPEAVVYHRDRETMAGYLRHMFRWGEHAPSVRGTYRDLKYSFLFPPSRGRLLVTIPVIVLGYTWFLWYSWAKVRPLAVTLALPQIFLGRLAYAWGVWQGMVLASRGAGSSRLITEIDRG